MKLIDAVGKACPIPVIMAKKEIEEGATEFLIIVDNKMAVENLKRLANNQGFGIQAEEKAGKFYVSFGKDCEQCEEVLEQFEKEQKYSGEDKKDYVIFVGKDYVGEGDHTLGRSLIQMFLYTLTQSKELPKAILFMNGGVKLAVEDEQCIEHLLHLSEKEVGIFVCGTCLNYYGIADKLKVGTVSNMYDIVEQMQRAGKVITI